MAKASAHHKGGKAVKGLLCILLALSLLVTMAACNGRTAEAGGNTETGVSSGTAGPSGSSTTGTTQSESVLPPESSTQISVSSGNAAVKNEELLQSASVDLDMDGNNEEVEIYQAETEDPEQPGGTGLEGILRIRGINGRTDTVFIRKPKGFTGVMNTVEFEDIDGDGAKDVFITIPDAGASYELNYYYIYNYKTSRSYKFDTDAALTQFAEGFKFSYKGKGLLDMLNPAYNFKAEFNITGQSGGNGPDDEINKEYEGASVDPSPVVINGDSRIALQKSGKSMRIKVPLPVFGLAAADMIGEVDIYYSVGADFVPVMDKFEVFDFKDDRSLQKIGEWGRS